MMLGSPGPGVVRVVVAVDEVVDVIADVALVEVDSVTVVAIVVASVDVVVAVSERQ
jgi:uncharacterized membrane protein